MPCPTCDHSMQSINDVAAYRVFICPRCGTVKTETYTGDPNNWHVAVYVPKLVERCRVFEQTFPPGNPPSVSYSREWHRLGISESINLPENRPEQP